MKTTSHLADSSDDDHQVELEQGYRENQDKYIGELQENSRNTESNYRVSHILADISNRLLSSVEVTEKYKKIKDPLEFKLEALNKQITLGSFFVDNYKTDQADNKAIQEQLAYLQQQTENFVAQSERTPELSEFLLSQKEENDKRINKLEKDILAIEDKQRLKTELESTLSALKEEYDFLETIYTKRNELAQTLKGAFPFIPRKLTLTFIENYNEIKGGTYEYGYEEILEELDEFRKTIDKGGNISPDSIKVHCAILGIKEEFKDDKESEYTPKMLSKISQKINRITCGEVAPSNKKQYLRLHGLASSKKAEQIAALQELKEYIDENLSHIHETIRQTAQYATDTEYLKMLDKQDFLTQVRVYRKLNRDIQKNTLIEGSEGIINVPPGYNTTTTLKPSGNANFRFGGDFSGKYSEFGQKFFATLQNYKNVFVYGMNPKEKEYELPTILQVEAIRSTISLLTSAMFFDLAEVSFEPLRENATPYSYDKIHEQMPMGMKDAVKAATYIEQTISQELTARFPYDYRIVVKNNKADTLNKKNQNILFDYLCFKTNARDIHELLSQDIDIASNNLKDEGWNISKKEAGFFNDKYLEITLEKEGYKLIFQKKNDKYSLSSIKSFPASLFNNLINEWYKIDLSYLQDQTIKIGIAPQIISETSEKKENVRINLT